MSSIYRIMRQMGALADFNQASLAPVIRFPWHCGYQPYTEARVVALADTLAIRMITRDQAPRTEVTGLNGPVYTDSCMELFLMPDPQHSSAYINWEFNSAGALFTSLGTDRFDRVNLEPERYQSLFQVKTSVDQDGWELEYQIPYAYLKEFLPHFTAGSGHWMRGNFYKCAEHADQPHYGCWAEIDLPQPDFHCPQFFGDLILG